MLSFFDSAMDLLRTFNMPLPSLSSMMKDSFGLTHWWVQGTAISLAFHDAIPS